MEYMSGGSLYDMLKLYPTGFRFLEQDVAYIIRETTCAVAYLHSMNRLHRDIKVFFLIFHYFSFIFLHSSLIYFRSIMFYSLVMERSNWLILVLLFSFKETLNVRL